MSCLNIIQSTEVSGSVTFSVLTTRTAAPAGHLLLLQHMDTELEHTDWIIAKLKANATNFLNKAAGKRVRKEDLLI